jgi:hypothetical protein
LIVLYSPTVDTATRQVTIAKATPNPLQNRIFIQVTHDILVHLANNPINSINSINSTNSILFPPLCSCPRQLPAILLTGEAVVKYGVVRILRGTGGDNLVFMKSFRQKVDL